MPRPRICIIGLDCLAPQLAFDALLPRLPTVQSLMAESLWGPLQSSVPPITVPAWASMVTGYDPGDLGVYGFSTRADHSYHRRRLASSMCYRQPPLWSQLSRAGHTCYVLGVPQTYPPKPLRGRLVSGPLTPSASTEFTYPPELGAALSSRPGGWRFDVGEYRTNAKRRLLDEIYAVTAQNFDVAEQWIADDAWDFFMMVEMGADRMHHAFWGYAATDHRDYVAGHEFEYAIGDYYVELDHRLGRLVALLSADDVLCVVSDHGAQTMHGAIALNQWLNERGYLSVKSAKTANAAVSFDPHRVDWSSTRAWADGGYVGRIYFNVRGREPNGCVEPEGIAALAAELKRELCSLPGPDGKPMRTRVYRPNEIYRSPTGVPPDLTIYFDDLRYRAAGSIGHHTIHLVDNDTGPDGANHASQGVILWRDGNLKGYRDDLTLYDVAPSVLNRFGLEPSPGMCGRII